MTSLEIALSQAIHDQQSKAAVAAAEILGDKGSAAQLQSRHGKSSPIAKALAHPNKRIRLNFESDILITTLNLEAA